VSVARPAIFLDRDGTIITDTGYVSRPDDVELIPGAAAAIRRANESGVAVIVVSNQSGIGRGYFGEGEYRRVQARMQELLRAEGARLDAAYHCPHAPDECGRPVCECRKPGTLLHRRAAAEHALDLARSWGIGDRWRVGGRGALVPQLDTPAADVASARERAVVADSLTNAVALALDAIRAAGWAGAAHA
jgi:D,D-heptose 1,7-bisphosphate phosphatase